MEHKNKNEKLEHTFRYTFARGTDNSCGYVRYTMYNKMKGEEIPFYLHHL